MSGSRARPKKGKQLVLLKDLVPRRDPLGGGATKPVFGESSIVPSGTPPEVSGKAPGKKKK